jgi:hypothetical protein
MSLFENDQYQWRETYFVLFDEEHRPAAKKVEEALHELGRRFQISDVCADESGRFESLTLLSPDDYAAMDVSCVLGDEVTEQLSELTIDLERNAETEEDKAMLSRLPKCTGRLDVFHFEQHVPNGAEGDDRGEFMDPGALLIVLQQLADLCQGVAVDPQTGTLLS